MSFFISEIRDTFVSLSAAKAIVKKKRHRGHRRNQKAYDLSALAEFLPEVSSSRVPTPTTSKLKCKSKQKLVEKEAKQLRAVLDHSAFQSDPVSAIQEHLKSTICVQADPQPIRPKDGTKRSGDRKHQKKHSKFKKIQPMEISRTV
ncbi:uncharacterized protein LOC116261112 isoform X2 [Nymphaea colorata]|uniref:uncharacterized protein LOC116261112 isoform X2 n=1 Tax=Nymphaea colorata TaxID=210225 RepID=UPI00214EEA48|nr:uncharacterized protein LOC116261112 isoform X2 [Nymphaea colorata]